MKLALYFWASFIIYGLIMKIKLYSILILVFFVCGCAGRAYLPNRFYPAPPEEPRLQFLASFSSSKDFEPPPGALKKFVTEGLDNDKPIVKPYGVAAYGNKIYICDTVSNSIDILDLERKKFEYFSPNGQAQLIDPINLCFDQQGNMYVADSRRGQVLIFDKNLEYIGAIGKKSELKPTGVLIMGNRIYICDLKTQSVNVYSLADKDFLFSLPKPGVKSEAKLYSPANIAGDKDGNIYVSDLGAFRVQKYSSSGDHLMTIGSHGDSVGQFARPKGIAVDDEGRIYVVDAAFENIQIFDNNGKLLLFFAGPEERPVSLVLPAGIAIDYSLKHYFSSLVDPSFEVEYLVLATSQYGDRKLNVFGYGHAKNK